MLRRTVFRSLALLGLGGCADRSPPSGGQARAGGVLQKQIGIATADGEFTPLVEAGQSLPFTFSETFTNRTDGGPEALVQLSQQDDSGTETIASLILAIPPVADNALQITVTLKIARDKTMMVKTTVAQTADVQEFGPFPVE